MARVGTWSRVIIRAWHIVRLREGWDIALSLLRVCVSVHALLALAARALKIDLYHILPYGFSFGPVL